MSREEVIREACSIMSLAYHSIANYDEPSDGFCDKCPAQTSHGAWNFKNTGKALAYVRAAVEDKLRRDGYTPCKQEA